MVYTGNILEFFFKIIFYLLQDGCMLNMRPQTYSDQVPCHAASGYASGDETNEPRASQSPEPRAYTLKRMLLKDFWKLWEEKEGKPETPKPP